MKKNNPETTGEALLELLEQRGVEYFFGGGGGTDFPPIFEAFAKRLDQGKTRPQPITVMHEITTMAMAHGYTMVSGQPAFAMVHTSVGTANAISGVINASRARTPIFLAAGRNSITEKGHLGSRVHGVHWAQECRDQAGMLREFVKWDYELRFPDQLESVIDRGFAICRSAPAGPVYLTFPLEVLCQAPENFNPAATPRIKPSLPAIPGNDQIRAVAEILAGARNPIAITSALGRDNEAVAQLVELAERLAMPVIEHWHAYMNFPQDHGLHLGYDSAPYLQDADVIVVLEADAPWFPAKKEPPDNTIIIQIDEDPLYQSYPVRGFATDFGLAGTPGLTLVALNDALAAIQPDQTVINKRRKLWESEHEKNIQAWTKSAASVKDDIPIDPKWISKCVADILDDSSIAVTEYILDPTQTCFTRPATFFNHSHAGSLGWGPGAALGAKLAAPDKTVVCCIGDGAHTFGVPTATHFMSRSCDLPILFVIYNNAAWGKSRKAATDIYPDGYASRAEKIPLCELEPSPDYARICEAVGGYGEKVEDPTLLPAALERALAVVKNEKRQALLDVICKK